MHLCRRFVQLNTEKRWSENEVIPLTGLVPIRRNPIRRNADPNPNPKP